MARDYSVLVKEILSGLRKNLSQEQLNRKMKFKTNQVARWECGHATIDWISFCHLAEVTKSPVAEALEKHLFFQDSALNEKALVKFLTYFHSQKSLAEKLEVSRSFVSRLISGQSKLDLETFLKLVDLSPYSLNDFITVLTAPLIPGSIIQEQERIAKEKQFHFDHPWAAALLLFLRTEEYVNFPQHSDRYLADKLGRSEESIAEALHKMEELGVIEKRGALYRPLNLHLSTSGNFEGARNIRKYWFNHCLQEIEKSKPGQRNLFGYKVFNIADSQREKFEEFYFRMNSELDALIRDNPGTSDKVYLFSFQMLDLDQERER